MTPSEELASYRYHLPIALRFADLDAMGHLNNAKYATYMEQIRIEYVRDVCAWQGVWRDFNMILARIEIDFVEPIFFEDAVNVLMRVSRLGNKSFDAQYLITRQPAGSQEPIIAARGKTVLVAYDYEAQTTIPIPEVWRERVIAFEPAL